MPGFCRGGLCVMSLYKLPFDALRGMICGEREGVLTYNPTLAVRSITSPTLKI
jgi:hypothetical protein